MWVEARNRCVERGVLCFEGVWPGDTGVCGEGQAAFGGAGRGDASVYKGAWSDRKERNKREECVWKVRRQGPGGGEGAAEVMSVVKDRQVVSAWLMAKGRLQVARYLAQFAGGGGELRVAFEWGSAGEGGLRGCVEHGGMRAAGSSGSAAVFLLDCIHSKRVFACFVGLKEAECGSQWQAWQRMLRCIPCCSFSPCHQGRIHVLLFLCQGRLEAVVRAAGGAAAGGSALQQHNF